MSNVNAPRGLSPVGTISGAPWNAQLLRCYCISTNASAMYIGDPVDFEGSSDTAGAAPTIALATAGATHPILGVIVAFEYDPTDLTLTYRKASTNRYAYVCVDPNTIYEVQADSTAVITADSVGANAVLGAGAGGSTVTGLSGWVLVSTTTPAADATYQVQILGAKNAVDNDITAVYARWLVKISLHRLTSIYDAHASAQYGPLGV